LQESCCHIHRATQGVAGAREGEGSKGPAFIETTIPALPRTASRSR
jgi:hypothetical protein